MPQPLVWHVVARGLGRGWLSLQGHFSAKKKTWHNQPLSTPFYLQQKRPWPGWLAAPHWCVRLGHVPPGKSPRSQRAAKAKCP